MGDGSRVLKVKIVEPHRDKDKIMEIEEISEVKEPPVARKKYNGQIEISGDKARVTKTCREEEEGKRVPVLQAGEKPQPQASKFPADSDWRLTQHGPGV
ncbi:hypothetical protein N7532_009614 [Penicillium argentinense]|uniref:Uncharacterized protein n=1 Tax=Penicillium argentinense TaxID=1131581 RepID=A0A9W9K314_9EURO|nr:uncharacterized protein N7532_009614 [Penicillium argentinense]KAJ5090930.1 hypothetical protein N7532_009614 [Penicillium argentinense]